MSSSGPARDSTTDTQLNYEVETAARSTRAARQQVIDQAAILNLYVMPTKNRNTGPYDDEAALHGLNIEMPWPTRERGVRAANHLAGQVGTITYRLQPIPYDYKMLPDSQPPPVDLDGAVSQRFAFQPCRVSIGTVGNLECFGTGRTFPMLINGRPRLAAAALAEVTQGTGILEDFKGNLTFCGAINKRGRFSGHVMVRLIDERARLLVNQLQSDSKVGRPLEGGWTFFNFVGQKGDGPDQENQFSVRGDGQPRGLNISTLLKQSRVGMNATFGRFEVLPMQTGSVIGREIGFGPLPAPTTPPEGLPLRPFPFEGVARYGFHDRLGVPIGAITTNVVEGRRMDIQFEQVPDQLGYRFGFFGPVIYGTGMLQGAQGLFYGASASFLSPPPGEHLVTHFYGAMIGDPDHRYRSNSRGSSQA